MLVLLGGKPSLGWWECFVLVFLYELLPLGTRVLGNSGEALEEV